MSFKNNGKRLGFTLAEIMISLAIVAILAIVTVPLINNQLEKTDEYAYYMAFKTVEKMASQVVLLGEDITTSSSSAPVTINVADNSNSKGKFFNNVKLFFTSLPQKFAIAESGLFKKLFPKSFAATTTTMLFDSDTFVEDVWLAYKVCNAPDNSVVRNEEVKVDSAGNVVYDSSGNPVTVVNKYNKHRDFNDCIGITVSVSDPDNPHSKNEFLQNLLPQDEHAISVTPALLSQLANAVGGTGEGGVATPKAFCSVIASNINTNYTDTSSGTAVQVEYKVEFKEESMDDPEGEPEDADDEYNDDVKGAYDYYSGVTGGICNFTKITPDVEVPSSGSATVGEQRPTFSDEDCNEAHGFYNMRNTRTDTIVCEPKEGYDLSENNNRVACPKVAGKLSFASKDGSSYKCEACDNTHFDEISGKCCPPNSIVGASGCECAVGWKWNSTNTACDVRTSCPDGYSMKDNTCVLNPPLIRAKTFCEKIADTWNTRKNYCDLFTDVPGLTGSKYYEGVYNAALGKSAANSSRLMSVDSKPGAFLYDIKTGNGLKPNIILSNGLYMWIMSDRLASIPGLTYGTDASTASRNVCNNLNKTSKTDCNAAGGYFCASENGCYTMTASSIDKAQQGMGDARNCCASPDFSDIAASMAGSTNSRENYLSDVRVYAVSGFVVFVDINGSKGEGTLWQDVYPFYVTSNGTVYPGYPLDSVKSATDASGNPIAPSKATYLGGNSSAQLPVDVYYYDGRVKKVIFPSVSYARAICTVRKMSKYSPYCLNLGEHFYAGKSKWGTPANQPLKGTTYLGTDDTSGGASINPCDYEACQMSVRRKLRSF